MASDVTLEYFDSIATSPDDIDRRAQRLYTQWQVAKSVYHRNASKKNESDLDRLTEYLRTYIAHHGLAGTKYDPDKENQ